MHKTAIKIQRAQTPGFEIEAEFVLMGLPSSCQCATQHVSGIQGTGSAL